jgi:hypothetical protein
MKTGPDALGTPQNEPGSASAPPKMCSGEQNMQTGLDVLGIAPNEFGCAKHEN